MELDAMDVDSHSSTDSSVEESTIVTSPNDKPRNWKKVARKLSIREQTIKREFKEYQENSTAYESEIEAMCRQTEQLNQKLRRLNDSLESENKALKDKTNRQMAIIDTLQSEIQALKTRNDELVKCNRRLEQENDDLERFNRESKMTEEETEGQLNETLERLALLETEIDEKESLLDTIQRLKDENRDLMQQLKVEQNRHKIVSRDSFSSTDDHSRNGSFILKKKSIRECVSETGLRIENWDKCDRMNKMEEKREEEEKEEEEEVDTKSHFVNEKMTTFSPVVVTVSQNYKAVIEEFKENKDEVPKKRQSWLSSIRRSSSNNHGKSGKDADDQVSSDSDCIDDHIKKRIKIAREEQQRQQTFRGFLDHLHFTKSNWLRRKKNNP